MTKYKNILFVNLLLLVCTPLFFSSCKNLIYEELPPCESYLRFVYEHNMKYADAFPHEVKKVNLYIFDEKGVLVQSELIEKEHFEKDFLLPLELPSGNYKLIAWAGLYDESYNYHTSNASTTIDQLTVNIKNNAGIVDQQLKHLWHGILDINIDNSVNRIYTLPLIKDTNTFRIAMMATQEGVVDMNNYEISISEDNGAYTHLNQIIPGHSITYIPYYRENVKKESLDDHTYIGSVCELRTGRLIAGQPTTLKIVSKKINKVILDVDLTDYLSILRMEDNAQIPFQEYLDRQDEYNITFFFTEGTTPETGFLSVKIFINGWLVRTQSVDK